MENCITFSCCYYFQFRLFNEDIFFLQTKKKVAPNSILKYKLVLQFEEDGEPFWFCEDLQKKVLLLLVTFKFLIIFFFYFFALSQKFGNLWVFLHESAHLQENGETETDFFDPTYPNVKLLFDEPGFYLGFAFFAFQIFDYFFLFAKKKNKKKKKTTKIVIGSLDISIDINEKELKPISDNVYQWGTGYVTLKLMDSSEEEEFERELDTLE